MSWTLRNPKKSSKSAFAGPILPARAKGGIANGIVLRGFRSQDMNILVDGHRIYGACPNHVDPAAFHADFAEVDRLMTDEHRTSSISLIRDYSMGTHPKTHAPGKTLEA